jgi:hypothetical protein
LWILISFYHVLSVEHKAIITRLLTKVVKTTLTFQTVKSFFEETLVAIPDAVLDSHAAELPSGRKDLFANVRGLLPPPYETREEEVVVYA